MSCRRWRGGGRRRGRGRGWRIGATAARRTLHSSATRIEKRREQAIGAV